MNNQFSHYPNFNVMENEDHWDEHTREIVTKRRDDKRNVSFQSLTSQEVDVLSRICAVLLDEQATDRLDYVVHHFDSKLSKNIGEAQRKVGLPEQSLLLSNGLLLLDRYTSQKFGKDLPSLSPDEVAQIVDEWMRGHVNEENIGNFPVTDFMSQVLSEAVSAYYSHPDVWSYIGYAGPAYPRGYVRSELGLTDPWEAKKVDQ